MFVSCPFGTVFLSAEPTILLLVFQFSYTAVFGAYTAFIFIRTGKDPHTFLTTLKVSPPERGPECHSRSPDWPGALPLLL